MRELEAALSGLRAAVRAHRTHLREEDEGAEQPKGRHEIGTLGRISTDGAEAVHARLRRRLAGHLRAMADKVLGAYRG